MFTCQKKILVICAKGTILHMKEMICNRCGANDWSNSNGYRKCNYCGTQFQLTAEDITNKESNISVNSDVEMLLNKCKTDPRNAKKYANLILDIDPSNLDALKYL